MNEQNVYLHRIKRQNDINSPSNMTTIFEVKIPTGNNDGKINDEQDQNQIIQNNQNQVNQIIQHNQPNQNNLKDQIKLNEWVSK